MTRDLPHGGLPGLMGLELTGSGEGWAEMSLTVSDIHMRPGIAGLHAGTMVTLADTACGYGCVAALPEGAVSFITLELKSNLVGTVTEGVVTARAEAKHLGRTTQVWHAIVRAEATGKQLALFQCTQLVIWP